MKSMPKRAESKTSSKSGRAKHSKKEPYRTKLDLFAQEFDSEDKLLKVLSDLFRKMDHEGVQITHGAAENGKDIVFFARGPLKERKVFACAVKNRPISGRADDPNGAMTIVNQARQALESPISDGKGGDLWIDTVYIITPYECAPATMNSVKDTLKRHGQIEFLCGQRLLELFAEYWPEFLWFESSILSSYLNELRSGLTDDYELAKLVLQKAFLAAAPGTIKQRYVEPTLGRELFEFELLSVATASNILGRTLKYADLQAWVRGLQHCATLLGTAGIWAAITQSGDIRQTALEIEAVIQTVDALWEEGYRREAARAREEAEQGQRSRQKQGFTKSKSVGRGFDIPSKNQAAIVLAGDPALKARLSKVDSEIERALRLLRSSVQTANAFAEANHKTGDVTVLASSDFLDYCRVADTARAVPSSFQTKISGRLAFDKQVLDASVTSLLISGAAGFGKTTFCRWHALRDAERLVGKEATILPVYVPLHTLLHSSVSSFETTFFATPALQELLKEQKAGKSPFDRIRLYLDGLDEVTPVARQSDIVGLAEKAARELPFLQVIMTGRDHVSGHWLRWLPRISLRELDEKQTVVLAKRWLPAERVDDFFEKLTRVPRLKSLMGVPLLATLILAVYDKRNDVPPNRTSLYGLFVELLAGGWDFYKNVQRGGQFGREDKLMVLTRLAGILHLEAKRDGSEINFRAAVKGSLAMFLSSWEALLSEIVEDGLLTRVGTNLAFSHLSFQEFLAARDLQSLSGHRAKQALRWYLAGNDWWREVLVFYVSLADRPEETDHWIADNARRASINAAGAEAVDDLIARAEFLQQALRSTFPAYKPSGQNENMAALQRKKDRLAV